MAEKWKIGVVASGLFFGGLLYLMIFHSDAAEDAAQVSAAIDNMIIMTIMFYVIAGLVYYKTTPNTKSLLLKVMGGIVLLSLIGSYLDSARWIGGGAYALQMMLWSFPVVVMGMEQNVIIVLAIARGVIFFFQNGGNLDEVVSNVRGLTDSVVEQGKKVIQENSPTQDSSFEWAIEDALENDPESVYSEVFTHLMRQPPDQVSSDKVKKGYKIFENERYFAQIIIKDKALARSRYKENVSSTVSGGQPLAVKVGRT